MKHGTVLPGLPCLLSQLIQ